MFTNPIAEEVAKMKDAGWQEGAETDLESLSDDSPTKWCGINTKFTIHSIGFGTCANSRIYNLL